MVPIWEQGTGRGVGYTLESFLDRFKEICAEHLDDHRAKAFAFIFYSFHDEAVREVLKNRDGFTQLDRLTGRDLSVFYLDDTRRGYVDKFNAKFLQLLGVEGEARPPCVAFFRVKKGAMTDTSVVNLDSENLLTSFHELYGVLQAFRDRAEQPRTKALRFLRKTAKFVGAEAVSGLIGAGLGHIL